MIGYDRKRRTLPGATREDYIKAGYIQSNGLDRNRLERSGLQGNGLNNSNFQSNDLEIGGLQSGGLQSGGLHSGAMETNGLQNNGLQSDGLHNSNLQGNGLHSNDFQSNGLERSGLWRNRYQKKAAGTGRAWIELDMGRLLHNVGILRSILPGACQLMPAVKANAYGHGAAAISRELNRLGVSAFCVASAAEGVELRKKKIKGEILVLGYTDPEQFRLLRRYRLMQTVVDYGYAKKLNAFGKRITVHIKVDTGMRRLGEPAESVENILKILNCENLVIAGIYSHFSAQDCGDPVDCAITQSQIDGFNNVLSRIREEGFDIPKAHIQNSFGVFARPDLAFDYARVGIALYGAYQSSRGEAGALLPVLSLKARVSAVKAVRAGETVGYGRAFAAGRDMKIAVLSIGYADGIPRAFSCGVGRVLINGEPAPIVGCVCMDQTTVDVTDIDGVSQGDVAVFIGRDGGAEISIMDFAEAAGTIPNEVLSRLGSRLERCVM